MLVHYISDQGILRTSEVVRSLSVLGSKFWVLDGTGASQSSHSFYTSSPSGRTIRVGFSGPHYPKTRHQAHIVWFWDLPSEAALN